MYEGTLLRQEILKRRDQQSIQDQQHKSDRIRATLLRLDDVKRCSSIFIYVSFRSEVQTSGIIDYLLGQGKTVSVPLTRVAEKRLEIIQIKAPQRELCQWNTVVKRQESIFEAEPGFEPSEDRPIVFHLHGYVDVPESLVLTEDDYLDFLVSISRERNLIPSRIQQAFRETSLLFLGYRLADWDFRVLFRSLAGYLEKSIQQVHVSVQLLPVRDQVPDELKREAREYLDKYFGRLNIKVYWGTCADFCRELARHWEAFNATGT